MFFRAGSISATVAAFTFIGATAHASPGITYEGQLLKPSGLPVNGAVTQFKIQIRTPGTEDCLLFEEIQTRDLSTAAGNFAISIGDGSVTPTSLGGTTVDGISGSPSLARLFANRGNFGFAAANCSGSPLTYAPSMDSGRKLVVSFKDETMATWEVLPPQLMSPAAAALNSYDSLQLAGLDADKFLRSSDGTAFSPLSNAQYTKLSELIAGTSGLYAKNSATGGTQIYSSTAAPTGLTAGTIWFDTSSSQMKVSNGSTFIPVGSGGGGTVTSVNTGTGLTGGGFTTSGTISIAAGGVGQNELANDSVTSAKIVDGTISLSDLASTVQTGVNAANSAVSSNAPAAIVKRDASGSFVSNTATLNKLALVNSGSTLNILNPIGGAWDLTLPATAGTSGQVLTTNGTGMTSWSAPSGASQWTTQAPGINYMSGNVGIGTTSPVSMLTVNGDIQTSQAYKTTVTGPGFMHYGNGVDFRESNLSGYAQLGTQNPVRLVLQTNAVDRLTIDPSGRVGIGTTSARNALTVDGSGISEAQIGVRNLAYQHTNPAYISYIQGLDSLDNPAWVAGIVDSSGIIQFGEKAANNHAVALTTAGAPRLLVDLLGNVGIGTQSPTSVLDVTTAGAAGAVVQVKNTLPGTYSEFAAVNSSGTSGSMGIRGSSAGGVGAIAANDVYLKTSTSNNIVLQTNAGNLKFATANTERLRIDNSGNVGIGTAAPTQKLSVVGVIESTSGGFKFPDGTTQTTAAGAGSGFCTSGSGSGSLVPSVQFNCAGVLTGQIIKCTPMANAAPGVPWSETIPSDGQVKLWFSGNTSAAVTSWKCQYSTPP